MNFKPHFITLGVSDLNASKLFYNSILKMTACKVSENLVFFDCKYMILALYPFKLLAEDARLKYKTINGFRGVTLSHNVGTAEEVDSMIDYLKKNNVAILKEAEDTFWGGRSAYFSDPDAHTWEIAWNPFMPFDKKGELIIESM